MRFTYENMRAMLAKNATDTARREGWPLTDCINLESDGHFYRDGGAVTLKPADETAADWIVYRQA